MTKKRSEIFLVSPSMIIIHMIVVLYDSAKYVNFCSELRSGDVFLRIAEALSMALIAIAENDSDYSNFNLGLATTQGVSLRSCYSKKKDPPV